MSYNILDKMFISFMDSKNKKAADAYNEEEYRLECIDNENKELKMSEVELLDKILEAATFLYVKNLGDSTSPNILTSKLPNKKYYVSLNRYMTPSDRYKKTIVYKTTRNTYLEALNDVATFLTGQKYIQQVNPLDNLSNFIKNKNNQINVVVKNSSNFLPNENWNKY